MHVPLRNTEAKSPHLTCLKTRWRILTFISLAEEVSPLKSIVSLQRPMQNIFSNIIVYQKYIGTSFKIGCATRSLCASSGPKAKEVPTTNQRGRDYSPLRRFRQGPSYSPNRLVSQIATFMEWSVQGCKKAKHKTYSPLDDCRVILTTSKAFQYFRARLEEIRFAFDPT